MLRAIEEIARPVGAWVLSDEVYRGIDLEGSGFTASMADLYERGISMGSMSKAYSLAGLRLGWIVGRASLMRDVTVHRHYNTISVGMMDDLYASIALKHRDAIMARNREIFRGNLALLNAWIAADPGSSYEKPRSGTTALVKYDIAIPPYELCVRLVNEVGVMEMERHVRVGYANARRNLEMRLPRVTAFLATLRAS